MQAVHFLYSAAEVSDIAIVMNYSQYKRSPGIEGKYMFWLLMLSLVVFDLDRPAIPQNRTFQNDC